LAAGGLDQLHSRGSIGKVDHRNIDAILGEAFGECLPDTIGATRDNGNFILVAFGHSNLPLSSPGRAQRESR
jgi:hypothetical protein